LGDKTVEDEVPGMENQEPAVLRRGSITESDIDSSVLTLTASDTEDTINDRGEIHAYLIVPV
jgi:hypothetical protein